MTWKPYEQIQKTARKLLLAEGHIIVTQRKGTEFTTLYGSSEFVYVINGPSRCMVHLWRGYH